METSTETGQPETDEEQNEKPDDAPNNWSAISASSAIAFACHFIQSCRSKQKDVVDGSISVRPPTQSDAAAKPFGRGNMRNFRYDKFELGLGRVGNYDKTIKSGDQQSEP